MGQYYIPTIFRKEDNIAKAYTDFEEQGKEFKPVSATPVAALCSHDFKTTYVGWNGQKFTCGIGLKLMEHSYVGNSLCKAIEHLLANEYAGHPVVWGGDYGDEALYDSDDDTKTPSTAYELGDRVTTRTFKSLPSKRVYRKWHKYILNHDTHEFVRIPRVNNKSEEWQVHPLPLLTCNGNGRGGGDYHPDNELIGAWCGHHLSVTNEKPSPLYKELKVYFPDC